MWHHLYGWLAKAEFTLGLALAAAEANIALARSQVVATSAAGRFERAMFGVRRGIVAIGGAGGAILTAVAAFVAGCTDGAGRVGAGAAAYAGGAHATAQDLEIVGSILNSFGVGLAVEEKDLDAVTGLSGSGPAYVFLFIEALADGAVKVGLSREVALKLALQTVYGAARMALNSVKHLSELKDEVTSPGGTTIAGLYALEQQSFKGIVMEAVVSATQRSQELGKGN